MRSATPCCGLAPATHVTRGGLAPATHVTRRALLRRSGRLQLIIKAHQDPFARRISMVRVHPLAGSPDAWILSGSGDSDARVCGAPQGLG